MRNLAVLSGIAFIRVRVYKVRFEDYNCRRIDNRTIAVDSSIGDREIVDSYGDSTFFVRGCKADGDKSAIEARRVYRNKLSARGILKAAYARPSRIRTRRRTDVSARIKCQTRSRTRTPRTRE